MADFLIEWVAKRHAFVFNNSTLDITEALFIASGGNAWTNLPGTMAFVLTDSIIVTILCSTPYTLTLTDNKVWRCYVIWGTPWVLTLLITLLTITTGE